MKHTTCHSRDKLIEGPSSDRGRIQSFYANYTEVGYNAFEFIIDFGQHYEGQGQARFHTRIITSPAYAKGILGTLQASLEAYEVSFGAIESRGRET